MPLHWKYRRTSIEVLLPFNWLELLPNGSTGSARPVEILTGLDQLDHLAHFNCRVTSLHLLVHQLDQLQLAFPSGMFAPPPHPPL